MTKSDKEFHKENAEDDASHLLQTADDHEVQDIQWSPSSNKNSQENQLMILLVIQMINKVHL